MSSSSVMAEKDGFIDCLNAAKETFSDIGITTITTDGNVSIRNYMAKEEREIKHGLDVWHVTKNLSKNLGKKAKKKV